MTRAEQITAPAAHHGEGPCWWDAWGGLRFVDMLAGDVLQLAGSGELTRHHVGDVAAVIRPRASGPGAVLALRDRFVVCDGPLSELRPLARVAQDEGVRLNEGGCDPDGRFYCGSMANDERPHAGRVHRVDAEGRLTVVLDGVTISNGFDFSPDGGRAYYIDTAEHGIDVFDYTRTDGLTGRRRWVDIAEEAGSPDGLVVDAEGGVWVAMMFGGSVRRYDPDGRLDTVIELPVRGVTACTFGGERLQTLYITTSRIRPDLAAQPSSGALFAVEPGVCGRRALPFAG